MMSKPVVLCEGKWRTLRHFAIFFGFSPSFSGWGYWIFAVLFRKQVVRGAWKNVEFKLGNEELIVGDAQFSEGGSSSGASVLSPLSQKASMAASAWSAANSGVIRPDRTLVR